METVYVLIQCDLGAEISIIGELAKIPEVREVRGTYGVYDIFCKIRSEDKETIDRIVTERIRLIQRIRPQLRCTGFRPRVGRVDREGV